MKREFLLLSLVLLPRCGGSVAGTVPDGGPPPSGAASEAGGKQDSTPPPEACQDDRPPAGAPFYEGGSMCTLPDGGAGVGRGAYGCVDPNVCHCKAAAGSATCRSGTCVYTACGGSNEGEACQRSSGGSGLCCLGTCQDPSAFANDPNNCGGCGLACPPGVACVNGNCGSCGAGALCSCDGVTCAPGRVCARTWCANPFDGKATNTCSACLEDTCASQPDGTPCPSGMCCKQACVAVQGDDQNCGGCGIPCCPGAHCSPGAFFPAGICF